MHPLEPDAAEMERMVDAALRYLRDFVDDLDDAPASNVDGALELAERLRRPPPDEPVSFGDALGEFADAAARAYEPAGPGYLAYIPGGGLFASAVAAFLAAGVNRYVTLAGAAPAIVQIEENVVRWLCDLFGLPGHSAGILTTGGSMANFSAVVAARRAMLPEDFLRGTLYASEQAHASVAKAASLAGFPVGNVRTVPVGAGLEMDAAACGDLVRRDRAAGLTPFCVVASAGTTNTGAIDPTADLASLCAEEELWLHVDAAYGGFFQLTERGRARLRGIEEAASITLDPHKGLFLPYGTGSLVVRDGDRLRDAHFSGAAYLQDLVAGGEVLPNFSEYSPELSRDFRGLRVWLPLQLHGVRAFRDALDEKLDLAAHAYARLREDPAIELPWEPRLSIVAFRLAPLPGATAAEENDRNRAFLERINASRRVFLSSTMIDERFTLRIAVLSHRTHRDRVDEAVDIIAAAART